jgi:hypothetical protein
MFRRQACRTTLLLSFAGLASTATLPASAQAEVQETLEEIIVVGTHRPG